MMGLRKLFSSIFLLFFSIVFVCLLLEGVLRFLPVNQTMRSMPVNDTSPVLRFEPDRTSTWSTGGNFCLVNTIHSNNYGFISDIDYSPSGKEPLLAVIGDSYVEAVMVPWKETVHGRLSEGLDTQMRVYSFGRSGAPLSQYVAYAEWVCKEFRPDKLVFIIIANDYDESLIWNKSAGGFHYYDAAKDGSLMLRRVDYQPGLLSHVASRSALLMYLLTNVKVLELPQQFRYRFFAEEGEFVGQTVAKVETAKLADSKRAVDAALAELPSRTGLPVEKMCFVVDGLRGPIYYGGDEQLVHGSFPNIMNKYLMERAKSLGYEVIDMEPVFRTDYDRNGEKFEFQCDGHWNARAHGLAANELLQSGFVSSSK